MEEEKDLQDERIDTVASLEKFKEEYRNMYYGFYKHKYPDYTYLKYLEVLKKLYSNESIVLHKHINDIKCEIPNWVLEKKQKDLWFEGLESKKKLILELEKILNFIYDEIDIENGKQIEQENLIKKLTLNQEKKERVELSAPERLLLLWELGLDDLPRIKGFDDNQYKKLIITILNFSSRDIEGYINSERNKSSDESRFIITNKHKEKVKKYLDNL
ncbi:MAG: hypothetical protein ACOH1X_07110 [Kaistella sp.]